MYENDHIVLEAIRGGHVRILDICKNTILKGLQVDRSLQRLRKAKRIKYDSKSGWSVVE